jgi:hypothetical protein
MEYGDARSRELNPLCVQASGGPETNMAAFKATM